MSQVQVQQKPSSLKDLSNVFSTLVETDEEVLVDEDLDNGHNVILYNDDHNTFDFVIETLVDLCEHEATQAEQCAFIVHFNGKCCVKQGSEKRMLAICREMRRRGLSAVVES